jgi:hypothetical protein
VRSIENRSTETKYFNTKIAAATTVSTAGTMYPLSKVPQGVGRSERVGDRAKAVSLTFKYTITVGAPGLVAGADQYNTVRVVVFKWLLDDAVAAPVTGNILDVISSDTVTNQLYNFDARADFRILYDKTHIVFSTPVYTGAATRWDHGVDGTFTCEKPIVLGQGMGGPDLDWEGNGLTGQGMYYVLLVSDSAFTPNPTCEAGFQLHYKDA